MATDHERTQPERPLLDSASGNAIAAQPLLVGAPSSCCCKREAKETKEPTGGRGGGRMIKRSMAWALSPLFRAETEHLLRFGPRRLRAETEHLSAFSAQRASGGAVFGANSISTIRQLNEAGEGASAPRGGPRRQRGGAASPFTSAAFFLPATAGAVGACLLGVFGLCGRLSEANVYFLMHLCSWW